MALLLSREELQSLTGVTRPTAMISWLESRNWVYERPSRRGDIPKVSRAYFESRMLGQPTSAGRRTEPRIDFMLIDND